MRRRDRFHLNRFLGGVIALMVGIVAFFEVIGPVGTDARNRVGQETDSGAVVLEDEALDTAYAEPTPAPSEPAWRDSTNHYRGLLHACGARMTQCGETCSIRWRQLMGVGR